MTTPADRDNITDMGATQIIEAIKQLNPTEQFEVIQFAKELDTYRKLTPEEVEALASRIADAPTPEEANRLIEELVRGFYGDEPEDAESPPTPSCRTPPSSGSSCGTARDYCKAIGTLDRVARYES